MVSYGGVVYSYTHVIGLELSDDPCLGHSSTSGLTAKFAFDDCCATCKASCNTFVRKNAMQVAVQFLSRIESCAFSCGIVK